MLVATFPGEVQRERSIFLKMDDRLSLEPARLLPLEKIHIPRRAFKGKGAGTWPGGLQESRAWCLSMDWNGSNVAADKAQGLPSHPSVHHSQDAPEFLS